MIIWTSLAGFSSDNKLSGMAGGILFFFSPGVGYWWVCSPIFFEETTVYPISGIRRERLFWVRHLEFGTPEPPAIPPPIWNTPLEPMDFSPRTIHVGGPCVGHLFWGARTNSVAGAGHEPRRGGRPWSRDKKKRLTKGHHLNSGWNMRKDRQNQTITQTITHNMQINCYLLILPLQLFCMKSCSQQLCHPAVTIFWNLSRVGRFQALSLVKP